MSYRMKTVETLTGLNRNTITTWERRYGLLAPGRDDSGYRAYSEEDVRRLRRVKNLLEEGYAIRDAVDLVLRAGTAPKVAQPPADGFVAIRDELFNALLRFDRAGADGTHARLLTSSFRARLELVYLPLLQKVGDGWAVGQVTIAQEHFVSAFCREHVVAMLQQLEGIGDETSKDVPVAVCAGLPGDPHDIALLSVSVQLALRGFRVVWLGSDLPLEELSRTARDVEADLICHSVLQPMEPGTLERWAGDLRKSLGSAIPIVFGGPGVAGQWIGVPGVLLCPTFADFVAAWRPG